jgi:tetratricopeptide (TPR) repeat protein
MRRSGRGSKSKARISSPFQTATFELEGMLFEADRNTARALAAYTQAIELGSANFYPYYRKAVITATRDAAARVQAEQLLERAVMLAPRFAPALVMLADVKVALARAADALPIARRAVALDPARVPARLALARALWAVSQKDEAVRVAREALELARSDPERQIVQRLIDTYTRP